MTFDLHHPIFDRDGYFLEDEINAYQEELMEQFATSPEGQVVLMGNAAHWADMFMDMVLRQLGMQLSYIDTHEMRMILYEVIPAHVVVEIEDAAAIIEELKAFFEFLKREFSLKNADVCLKALHQKNILKRFTQELNNPNNYGPSKTIAMQMLDAGVDITDQTQVAAFIDDYNAKMAEAMKPAPVTDKARDQHKAAQRFIREVCTDALNEECYDMSIKLLDKLLFQFPDRLERGQAKSWAAAIVYTIGRINFLFDPRQIPHLVASELAQKFNVSQGMASKKSSELFDLFDLTQFDPDWTLPSLIDMNPFIWQVMVDGWVVDIRTQPRELQVMAYEQGIIPYIPADQL